MGKETLAVWNLLKSKSQSPLGYNHMTLETNEVSLGSVGLQALELRSVVLTAWRETLGNIKG